MSDVFGIPTEEQLQKINKLSKKPLKADEVFCFSGKSAGDILIPGRYTRLSPALLNVMADDARKGVSFMLNHNWSSYGGVQAVPYGKVFYGRISPSSAEGETVSLELDKYIVRDDEIVDGVSANALIKRIESGVLSDTSIGWTTDTMECSICGLNYYGGECSHYRGHTYTLADGTQKMCTVLAMPPKNIIPYNNNALFEESIVWDGAYPGAMITQSKHGDIIETQNGKFAVLDDKEQLPNGTAILGQYCNGNIITLVKKEDHKKVFAVKGGEDNKMNEKLSKFLETLGVTYKEGETKTEEVLNQVAEKWYSTVESIKVSLAQTDPTPEFMSKNAATEKLGNEMTADEVLKLAKEGQEYHKLTVDSAIAMGVKAMGNDFPADTWKSTFASMNTQAINDIAKTWETQAKSSIPVGRFSNTLDKPDVSSIPDEAYKVGK